VKRRKQRLPSKRAQQSPACRTCGAGAALERAVGGMLKVPIAQHNGCARTQEDLPTCARIAGAYAALLG
jgi:hypothetical protein